MYKEIPCWTKPWHIQKCIITTKMLHLYLSDVRQHIFIHKTTIILNTKITHTYLNHLQHDIYDEYWYPKHILSKLMFLTMKICLFRAGFSWHIHKHTFWKNRTSTQKYKHNKSIKLKLTFIRIQLIMLIYFYIEKK